MPKSSLLLRENQWTLLDGSHAIDPFTAEHKRLHEEIQGTSQQIKKDLGLREVPLSLQDRDGRLAIRAAGISGAVELSTVQLQIAPKFVRGDLEGEAWQASVLALLSRAQRKQFTYTHAREISAARTSFFDHVALAYIDALELALRDEPIRTYQVREIGSHYLRGRFSVQRQLRSALSRPHVLQCDVDYLDADNEYNHLLHWAAHRFSTLSSDFRIRRRLREVQDRLPRVGRSPLLPHRRVGEPPAQFRHYSRAIAIASMLAKGYGHGQTRGRETGYGFVINMEKLFETFLERTLKYAVEKHMPPSFRVEAQERRLYAEPWEGTTESYYTRPDNVLYEGSRPRLVLDAKYKSLMPVDGEASNRPHNPDVYQLFASLVAHGCDSGLLVYPYVSAANEAGAVGHNLRIWRGRGSQANLRIAAVAVDVADLSSREAVGNFDREVSSLIERILTLASSAP